MFEDVVNRISVEYPRQVLNDLLPNQMVQHYSSTNGSLNNIEFSSKNKRYKGSDYYINPEENQFIHFTSFENTKEIISNNKLRLYDLNYADDPHEIIFTIKSTGINFEIDYYKLKSLLYSMSFCSYPLIDDDEHAMWRLYGRDGYGIGLVCSFCNNCEEWDEFHFSKMFYTSADKITEAFSKHKAFFEGLNSEMDYKTQLTEENLLFNLLQLFAFHKHTIYGSENEFRLLHRFNNFSLHKKDLRRVSTINKSNKLSNYTELNLCEFAKGKFELDKSKEYSPLIKIDKILLGTDILLKQKEEIEQVIREVYVYNHDIYTTVTPKIEITSLKENTLNKMIHIVHNAADVEVLQKAIELDETLAGEIIQIKDDYAVGPLQDIYTAEGIETRKQWWRAVLTGSDHEGSVESGEVDDAKTVEALIEKLNNDPEEKIWIWAAQNKHDVCSYYWLMSQLKEYQGRVLILYLNNLPFLNEKGNIFYPTWLHEIPAKEFLKAKKLAREITLSEFEVDPDEWLKTCNDPKGVRLLEGGKKLTQEEYDFYDVELKKFITADWQKASKIIHQYLSKAKHTTGDMYLLWRLKTMIAMDMFDVQGNVGKMKDFEVKLKS